MRQDAIRRFDNPPPCHSDDDCVVMSTAVECGNVHLGDCGMIVHRAVAQSVDWKRINAEICDAVEGSQYGCMSGPACLAVGPPRCEQGRCSAAVVSGAL